MRDKGVRELVPAGNKWYNAGGNYRTRLGEGEETMRRYLAAVLAGFLALLIPGLGAAAAGWRSLKTEHFTVLYKPGYEQAAERALGALEHFRPAVERLTGNTMFHLPVVIEDTGYANGLTNPVFPGLRLFTTSPGPDSELGFGGDWWSLLGPHEYIHALSASKTGGVLDLYRILFGNLFQPNLYAPRWILEGITVYGESQLSSKQGRLNDGYFDAYLGASVQEGRLPSLVEATHAPLAYPLERHYLFGGEFFRFLAEKYGEARFAEFFAVNGSNLESLTSWFVPSLGLDVAARQVFGKTFPALWGEWQAYERERFAGFRMDGERLTHHGWTVQEPRVFGGRLYYKRQFPVSAGPRRYWRNQIVERDLASGKERVLLESTASFLLPLRLHGGKLYYGTAERQAGFANTYEGGTGLVARLHERDLASGKDSVVLTGALRSFDLLADGRILYAKDRRDAFGSELRLWNPATREDRLVGRVEYLVEEIAADGERIVVAARRDGFNAGLFTFTLETLDFAPLFDSPGKEYGLTFAGDWLHFTSNAGRTYAAYRYDFTAGKAYRLTEGGYAAQPAYDEREGKLYFVGLTSAGFDLFRKTPEPVEVAVETGGTERAGSSSVSGSAGPPYTLDWSKVTRGTYADNLKTLAPAIRLPLAEFDPYGASYVGVVLVGSDALGDFYYQAQLGYDNAEGQAGYDVQLESSFLAPLQVGLAARNTGGQAELALDTTYPLVSRLSPGLSHLSAGVAAEWTGDSARPAVTPHASLGLTYPRTRASLAARLPVRAGETGVEADLGVLQNALGGDLELVARYRNDRTSANPELPEVRGYREPLAVPTGETVSAEYHRTLFRIDRGLWNPSVFLEDTYLTLFAEAAVAGQEIGQASSGAELHLRGMALGFPAHSMVRYVRTREGEEAVELGVDLSLAVF